jgi:hypothetical protein
VRRCHIDAIVPKPLTSNSKADGRFDKRDFVYDAQRDEYRCPAGERAIWRFSTVEDGMTLHKYWSSACPECQSNRHCTDAERDRSMWAQPYTAGCCAAGTQLYVALRAVRQLTEQRPDDLE